MPLPILKVDASIYEQFIVPSTNVPGDENGTAEPVTLTDKQILLLYMSGVRPDEIKHKHASDAARNEYLTTHKEASEAFREQEKTPICPGMFFCVNRMIISTLLYSLCYRTCPRNPGETDQDLWPQHAQKAYSLTRRRS